MPDDDPLAPLELELELPLLLLEDDEVLDVPASPEPRSPPPPVHAMTVVSTTAATTQEAFFISVRFMPAL